VGSDADATGADAGHDRVIDRVGGGAFGAAALALLLAVAATGLGAAPPAAAAAVRVETSAPHMGTLVRIVLYADTRAHGDAAAVAAFARIAEIDARLSDYRDDSEVAALARATPGVAVPLSDDLFTILARSEAIARRTGGAFDVTAGRLTHLWRRARRLSAWPEAARVAEARDAGGYAKVRLDAPRRAATLAGADLEFDAGGIAKGYAADEALRVLHARGIGAALVGLGGDLAAGDPPPGRTGWTVAIPRLAAPGATAEPFWIELAHAAVSTSGDAEQWMTVDGVRRSHVVDLRTGWPVTGRSASSVVARHGIDADALSTALGILDREAGAALLRDHAPAGPAHALWQQLRADGTADVHVTAQWPAMPRPVAITARGTP
jgi:thiamine biosynthesis lipoprotein